MTQEIYYYSTQTPFYVKDSLKRYGYKFQDLESVATELEAIKNNKNIIWYEKEIDQLIDNVSIINHSLQKNILVIDHHFNYHEKIKKLDMFAEKNKIVLLGTQYLENLYEKINCYSLSSSEIWCHHDFIYYMIKNWRSKRITKEETLFLFMPSYKNQERKEIIDGIHKNLKEDLLKIQLKDSQELYKKRKEFDEWMKITFDGSNMLGGFGSGTPRFDLYDRVFCEIVIETTYNTPTVHVTEKTWKPISSGFPCCFLINAANIKYLKDQGYELSPKFLYDDLSRCDNDQQAIDVFIDFAKKLKQSENLKKELLNMAEYNYKKFWTQKSYWEHGAESVRKVFGYCPLDQIIKKLEEI